MFFKKITFSQKQAISSRKESFMVISVIFLQLISWVILSLHLNAWKCIFELFTDANVGNALGFDKFWRYTVTTILSLICSYTLFTISLWSIWNIEGTINPLIIFNTKTVHTRTSSLSLNKRTRDRVQSKVVDIDTYDLCAYLATDKENYDRFAEYLRCEWVYI